MGHMEGFSKVSYSESNSRCKSDTSWKDTRLSCDIDNGVKVLDSNREWVGETQNPVKIFLLAINHDPDP